MSRNAASQPSDVCPADHQIPAAVPPDHAALDPPDVIDLREAAGTGTQEAVAADELLPWDDPAYWPPVPDEIIELAAAAFRKYLKTEENDSAS